VEGLIRSKFTVLQGIYDGEDGFCFVVDGVEYIMPIRVMCEYAARAASISALALKALDPEDTRGWHRFFDAWADQGVIPTA